MKRKNVSEKTDVVSPISAKAYAALTDGERAAYRPVDSRYDRLPLLSWIMYGISAVCLMLYLVMLASPAFSDFFNRYISTPVRILFSTVTSVLPFSLAECILLLLPLILALILIYAVRRRCDTWRQTGIFVLIILSIVATIFSLFVTNFAAGYRGTTLDKKLGITRTDVSAEELYSTALILVNRINEDRESIGYATDDFSIMPYTVSEMNDKLCDAYASFCAKDGHEFITHTDTRIKPVMNSEVMSYMHITGVYAFFTGEANLNVVFPDYTLPYTAAHEMAHQRGIAREDEANFMAYLVCMESDDPYIRYSAHLNMYEYVANALYDASPTLYYDAVARLDTDVRYELAAYSQFFDKYRNSTASQISGAVNDTFLQSQGTPGTKSYGMVVDLAVAYYRPVFEK